jgi:hypothetical protein
MKCIISTFLMLVSFSFCLTSYRNGDEITLVQNNNNKMKITVGKTIFRATLNNSATTKAFKEMLPLTINMAELNGDEKYYDLPNNLPTNSSSPGTTKNGDLMLFGSRTLVLFYKTHSTSYNYTKLGVVDDVTGLAKALGAGNVNVKFE